MLNGRTHHVTLEPLPFFLLLLPRHLPVLRLEVSPELGGESVLAAAEAAPEIGIRIQLNVKTRHHNCSHLLPGAACALTCRLNLSEVSFEAVHLQHLYSLPLFPPPLRWEDWSRPQRGHGAGLAFGGCTPPGIIFLRECVFPGAFKLEQ